MIYSDKVMEHFQNPRNVGVIKDADGIGKVGNPVCGDMMTFYIKVKDDRLADIKFQTFGCGAAIAVSSIVSEMAMGKTLEEAMLLHLDMKGVAASSGSACTSKSLKVSHVLLAMGVGHALAQGSLVFSLLETTSAADIDRVLEVFPPIVDNLRRMSPLYTKFLEEKTS